MNRRERRRAMIAAGLTLADRRAVAYYRAERLAGREHCVTADLAVWVGLGLPRPAYERPRG